MSDLSTRITRSVVPIAVGAIVTFASNLGLDFSDKGVQGITALVAGAVGIVYYVLVTLLEEKFPKIGALLGKPVRPEYVKSVSWLDAEDAPVEDPDDDADEDVDEEEVEADADVPPETPGKPLDDNEPWEDEPRDSHGRFTEA